MTLVAPFPTKLCYLPLVESVKYYLRCCKALVTADTLDILQNLQDVCLEFELDLGILLS